MKCGVIGLGKMGSAIAYRLTKAGKLVVGYDVNIDNHIRAQAERDKVTLAASLQELAQECEVIWLLVPAGKAVDIVIDSIQSHVQKKAIIIDAGNSLFTDSQRRAFELAKRHITFLDCGTSGGIYGRENGFCLMIGGEKKAYEKLESLFQAIAAPHGYMHMGPSGTGHYVKMIHNGIEYGMMQAYAEGLQLIKEGTFKNEHLDLAQLTGVWNHGAVIRSWLLELTHDILEKDQELETVSGKVAESGTGSWTVQEAHNNTISVPVIEKALHVRHWSRQSGGNYATKLVALMRHAFGGHPVGHKE